MRTKNFITDLRDAVTRLNNALAHAERETEFWESTAERRMNIITKQDDEIASLKGKIDGLDLIIQGLNLDIAGMVKGNNDLNVQIVRLTHDNDALHDECLHREEMCAEYRSDIYRLKSALVDITKMPEGDEQSAQAVAREVLKYW